MFDKLKTNPLQKRFMLISMSVGLITLIRDIYNYKNHIIVLPPDYITKILVIITLGSFFIAAISLIKNNFIFPMVFNKEDEE